MDKSDVNMWRMLSEHAARKTIVMNDAGQEIIDSENFFGRPMLGKIVILPKSKAEEFKYDKPWACISICNTYDGSALISVENRVDLLQLHFDDIEFERDGSELKKISSEQAKEILEFSNKVWEEIELMMIHCTAGISRSPAIGQVISEIHQPSFAKYFSQLYSPNNLVYKEMRKLNVE